MPKPFTTIVPPSFKAVSETYQYAPAVRIGDQILISGIVGADADGRLPPDFRSQAENVFMTLEAVLSEAGATLDDVGKPEQLSRRRLRQPVARTCGHKGDADPGATPGLDGRWSDATRGAGGLLEISAVVVARD
jgi:hypothetical protein